jgi:gliding motility-associated-like protein
LDIINIRFFISFAAVLLKQIYMRMSRLLLLACCIFSAAVESSAQCTVVFNPVLNPQNKVVACEDVTFAFLNALFTDASGISVNCSGIAPCSYVLHDIDVTNTVLPTCSGGIKETYTRTFTFICPGGATACGQPNVVCATQTIQVQDTEAPFYADFPEDVTVACEAWDLAEYLESIDWALQPSDNCSVNFTEDQDFSIGGTCPSEPEFLWTFTLTDECGNASQRTHTVSIEDGTAPVLGFNPAVAGPFTCTEDVVWPTPIAADGCDPNPTAFWIAEPITLEISCPDRITLLRTARAEDGCGNFVDGDLIIEVFDNVAPDFGSYPTSFDVELGEPVVFPDLQPVDGCNGPVFVISETDTTAGTGCASGSIITMTYSAADYCGNISTAVISANIADTQGPEFGDLSEASVSCGSYPDGAVLTTASDPSGVATIVVLYDTPLLSAGCAGNPDLFERHYLATDSCGNTREGVQLVRLVDTAPPVFDAPLPLLVLDCTDFSEAIIPTPAAVDSCSAVTFTFEDEDTLLPGDCANGFQRVRVWTATDACGNAASAEQILQVLDLSGPSVEFNPTGPLTFTCDEDIVWPEFSATDACSGVVSVDWLGPPVLTDVVCTHRYTASRTLRAIDGCGNVTDSVFTVVVYDDVAPVFVPFNPEVTFEFTENLVLPIPPATDNCAGSVVVVAVWDTLPGSPCPGTFDVLGTFTATDVCGNTASAQALYHVVDTQAPTFEGAEAVFINCENYPDPTNYVDASDPSGLQSFELIEEVEVPGGGCAGQYERTYAAVDSCGNEGTFTQLLTLLDDVAPVIFSVPADTSVSCADLPLLELQTVGATDNCDAALTTEISYDDTYSIPGCYGTFVRIRTWTLSDVCGNATSASQTIEVTDELPPVVTDGPGTLVFDCLTDVPSCAAYFGDFTFSPDGCPGAIALDCAVASTSGDCAVGPCDQTWIYTFDDGCGNTSSASVQVNIANLYGDPVFQTGLTPNSDGYNDTYTIGNIGPDLGTSSPCDWLPFTEFAVFSRWGQRVFWAEDYRNTWDGTDDDGAPLPDGTYYAVFTFNGTTHSTFIDIRR